MHWKQMFPSEHLEHADIPAGGTMTLRIERVDLTTVEGERGQHQNKALITFTALDPWARDFPKRTWIAPKTVCACLGAMFGDHTDGWVGKRVAVCVERVDAFGEQVDAVRVAGSPDITKRIVGKVRKGRTKATVTLMPTADPSASTSTDADARKALYARAQQAVSEGAEEPFIRALFAESGICSEDFINKACGKLFPAAKEE